MVQLVNDLVMPQLWLRFSPCWCMLGVQPKKKKKRKKEGKKQEVETQICKSVKVITEIVEQCFQAYQAQKLSAELKYQCRFQPLPCGP